MLDRLRPGWENAIVVESLDMDNICDCVLGQLYGSYCEGLGALGLNGRYGCTYGFNIFPTRDSKIESTMEKLTTLWVAEINKRRN